MKNLTPAKMMMMVFGAIAVMIGLFVAKRLLAVEPPKRPATRNIPLALGDLAPGTVIRAEHIGLGPWPAEDVRDDMLLSNSGIVGRVVKEGIKAATPIHGRKLYQLGELPPLRVSDGYQAVTVRTASNSAMLEGLIKPGDHVDVHFTLNSLQGDPRVQKLGGVTMTVFRGVRVLALNRDFVQAPLQATQNSVTLEVPATDANLLLLAANKGDLSLTYTANTDGVAAIAMSDADRATLEDMLKLEPIPEEPAPKPPEPPHTTFIYRRASHQVNQFKNGQLVTNGNASATTDAAGGTGSSAPPFGPGPGGSSPTGSGDPQLPGPGLQAPGVFGAAGADPAAAIDAAAPSQAPPAGPLGNQERQR